MRLLPALLQASLVTSVLSARWIGPIAQLATGGTVLLAPTVDVATANPGADIERSACVTVAIRPSVSYECGDLRVSYTLPAMRYFNKTHAPTLLYNSQHAKPTPIVRAWVTNPAGGTAPATVTVTLFVLQGGSYVQRASLAWGVSGWTPGTQRQVALSFDATDLATGLYPYRLEVAFSDGSGVQMTPATGELAIVNRSTSEFGRGWWVAGYERVIWQPGDHLFWIGGDGSTRWYQYQRQTSAGRRLYYARSLAGLDSMTSDGFTKYYRHLPQGAWVQFDVHGRQEATVDALGRRTQFGSFYGCGRLGVIRLSDLPGQPLHGWSFNYDKDNSPQPCVGQALHTSSGAVVTFNGVTNARGVWRNTQPTYGLFMSVADVNGQTTLTGDTLVYEDPSGRITTLRDTRGTTTTFVYGSGGLLDTARAPTGVGTESVIQRFRAGEGAALASPDVAANLYTALYSPRPEVSAFTKLWLGPWGNPLTVTDAVGRTTSVLPHGTFPLLAARVTNPAGWSQYASYNTHGKLTYMNADPVGGTGVPEWYYYYDHAAHPDLQTRARDAAGVWTKYTYNGPVFNTYPSLSEIENTADAATRVSVTYCTNPVSDAHCLGLPKTTLSPQNAQGQRSADTLAYDALGNLARSLSHDGKCTEFVNDGIGRVLVTRVRVSGTCRPEAPPPPPPPPQNCPPFCQLSASASAEPGWLTTTTTYDALDRVDSTQTVAPADGGTPLQTLSTTTRYDGASDLVVSVRRWSTPDDGALGVLRDSMQYDALGRVRWKLAQGQSVAETYGYDAAGNVTQRTTPKGALITMAYDALNRLTLRTAPPVAYDSARVGSAFYAPWDSSRSPGFPRLPLSAAAPLAVDGEVATFTYDDSLNVALGGQATGAVRTANNRAARTSRRYFPNGLIKTDSQWIAAVDDSTDFSQHGYGITYTYDQASRRTGLQHPAQLAAGLPTATETVAFTSATGLPEFVRDLHQRDLHFTFDPAGQLTTQTAPNLRRDLTYTRDGEVATDRVQSLTTTAGAPLPTTGGWARKVALSYDRRGKLMALYDSVGLLTRLTSTYAPMGPLRTSQYQSFGVGPTGNLVAFTSTDTLRSDALGNSVGGRTVSSTNVNSGGWPHGGGTTSTWQLKSFQYATDGSGRLNASTPRPSALPRHRTRTRSAARWSGRSRSVGKPRPVPRPSRRRSASCTTTHWASWSPSMRGAGRVPGWIPPNPRGISWSSIRIGTTRSAGVY